MSKIRFLPAKTSPRAVPVFKYRKLKFQLSLDGRRDEWGKKSEGGMGLSSGESRFYSLVIMETLQCQAR